jgi:hypothetical protein
VKGNTDYGFGRVVFDSENNLLHALLKARRAGEGCPRPLPALRAFKKNDLPMSFVFRARTLNL